MKKLFLEICPRPDNAWGWWMQIDHIAKYLKFSEDPRCFMFLRNIFIEKKFSPEESPLASPIFSAVENSYITREALELLLEYGWTGINSAHNRAIHGDKTPLDVAREKNNAVAIEFFEWHPIR